MSDQILITQTLAPTQRPDTGGEVFDRTVLPNGSVLTVGYRYDAPGTPYPVDSYVLQRTAPDGTAREERVLATGDSSTFFSAGLGVAQDGSLFAYSYDDQYDGPGMTITPIAADGTFGEDIAIDIDLPRFERIQVVPLNGGSFVVVFNRLEADNTYSIVFAPFNADGTASNQPAVLGGEDYFSAAGQFIPFNDGRLIFLRDTEMNLIGAGGFPGNTQQIFNRGDDVAFESYGGATPLDLGEGRLGLMLPTYVRDDFETPNRILVQIIGPGGGAQGAATEILALGFDSAIIASRVTDDGGVVVLTGTARAQVQLHRFDSSLQEQSVSTVYSATIEETGRTISEDIFAEFAAVFRPDGGFVLTMVRADDTGDALFLQNYSADGRPDGLPFEFDEGAWFARQGFALGESGDLQFRWDSAHREGQEGITNGVRAFDIITPRVLSDAADTETLAEAGAVDGGAGADVITGSTGDDRLLGGAGDDMLSGSAGADLLRGDAGDDTLDGGASEQDTAFYQGGWEDYAAAQVTVGGPVTITGLGPANADGTDVLTGIERLVFADRAVALDAFIAEISADFEGTDAPDSFQASSGNNRLNGLGGDDTLDGGGGSDTINGGDGDDHLTGGTSPSDLRDVIYGGNGNDLIDGGYGNDALRGDGGDDTIAGGFGADTVLGGTGDDVLTGSALGDLLFGGDGDDFVNGGFGFDRVNGGAGADQFYHLGVENHGSDWIQDYDAAQGDVLVFGNARAMRAQFQINVATTPTAGAADVDEAFIIYRPTGQIIWALVDGDGQNEINLRIGGEVFDLTA